MHTFFCTLDEHEDGTLDDGDDSMLIEAADARAAAEQAAENAHANSAAWPHERIVWVRAVGAEESQCFRVSLGHEPAYHAAPLGWIEPSRGHALRTDSVVGC